MGQLALHQFPWVDVEYDFKCRNKVDWDHKHLLKIKKEVEHFCSLKFTEEELDYLSSIRFFKKSYIDFLKLYQPDISHITVDLKDGELCVSVKGPWFLTIYFEVPILAIINEVYFEDYLTGPVITSGREILKQKKQFIQKHPFPFVDFGTRRRFSHNWHEEVIWALKDIDAAVAGAPVFKGTSNVYFAKKYGLTPIGTHAHELFQVFQGVDCSLKNFQKEALQAWVDEYRGDLGIALTDIIGIDAFLEDFDLYFAKLYDGVRHDSGSPENWARKVINHYKKLGIDPKTKTLIFSDGLTMGRAADLYDKYSDEVNVSAGIGTSLTNDFDTINPLQIVMKIVECNGRPVAKISDSSGKSMCKDERYVEYLKKVFNVER